MKFRQARCFEVSLVPGVRIEQVLRLLNRFLPCGFLLYGQNTLSPDPIDPSLWELPHGEAGTVEPRNLPKENFLAIIGYFLPVCLTSLSHFLRIELK